MGLTFTPIVRAVKAAPKATVAFDEEFLTDIKEAIAYAFANPMHDLSVTFPDKSLRDGFVGKVQAYAKREGTFVFRTLPNSKTDAEEFLRFRIMSPETAEKLKAEKKKYAEDLAARRARGESVPGRVPKPKVEVSTEATKVTLESTTEEKPTEVTTEEKPTEVTTEEKPTEAPVTPEIPAQSSPSPAIMPGRKAA